MKAETYGFRWTNRAGVSWRLTFRAGQKSGNTYLFDVSKECPYYKSGYKVAKMIIESDKTILLGPHNEPYIKFKSITGVFSYKERLVLLSYIQWHFKLVT
jgi:hypothetical protein